jgi:hypothetical protein
VHIQWGGVGPDLSVSSTETAPHAAHASPERPTPHPISKTRRPATGKRRPSVHNSAARCAAGHSLRSMGAQVGPALWRRRGAAKFFISTEQFASACPEASLIKPSTSWRTRSSECLRNGKSCLYQRKRGRRCSPRS